MKTEVGQSSEGPRGAVGFNLVIHRVHPFRGPRHGFGTAPEIQCLGAAWFMSGELHEHLLSTLLDAKAAMGPWVTKAERDHIWGSAQPPGRQYRSRSQDCGVGSSTPEDGLQDGVGRYPGHRTPESKSTLQQGCSSGLGKQPQ